MNDECRRGSLLHDQSRAVSPRLQAEKPCRVSARLPSTVYRFLRSPLATNHLPLFLVPHATYRISRLGPKLWNRIHSIVRNACAVREEGQAFCAWQPNRLGVIFVVVFSPRRTSRKASGGVLFLGERKYACRASCYGGNDGAKQPIAGRASGRNILVAPGIGLHAGTAEHRLWIKPPN